MTSINMMYVLYLIRFTLRAYDYFLDIELLRIEFVFSEEKIRRKN